jgi:hypothetical protein
MNFLTPWFLLGALAVGGPILFHLIRRAARERAPFSSLMFLRPTPPRAVRRRKIEHLWLLLLRCVCLLLLATGFARPFFPKDNAPPVAPAQGRQVILLLDTSASMRREDLWRQARALAGRCLEKVSPSDEVAVATFDRQPRSLVSFAEWSSWAVDQRVGLAQGRMAGVSPGWMGTHLGLALTSAAGQFQDALVKGQPATRREIVLISDMQEGAKLDGLQGHEWPAGTRVTVERVESKQASNAGLEVLEPSAAAASADTGVQVRVSNDRNSRKESFRLRWKGLTGTAGQPIDIYLLPGKTHTITAPKLPEGTAVATLELSGDDADFDNLSYFAAPEVEHVRIACPGPEAPEDPGKSFYYLQRVFPATPRRHVQFVALGNGAVAPESLNQAAFAVIATNLAPEETALLGDWLRGGKSALLVLADAQAGKTLAGLVGLPEIQVTEAGGDYALLGEIDFKHPIFAPFDDPRFSDFSHIHFWKHRRWEIPSALQARVLAKFDDGAPALAQVAVGKGNLLVLASGWTPADSQLAVSSKFPPLMQMMLDWSGASAPARSQFCTGEAIPSPAPAGGDVRWRKPDGQQETLPAGAPFSGTESPGIYEAAWGGKARRFAVNLPIEESRVAPLSPDELARLGVPLGPGADQTSARTGSLEHHLQQAELENRQKIWRWLIVAALAITFGEMLLSGCLARRVTTAESTL